MMIVVTAITHHLILAVNIALSGLKMRREHMKAHSSFLSSVGRYDTNFEGVAKWNKSHRWLSCDTRLNVIITRKMGIFEVSKIINNYLSFNDSYL